MARVSASLLLRPVVCLYLSSSSSRALLHASRRHTSRHAYSSLREQSNLLGVDSVRPSQTYFARRTLSLSASAKGESAPDNDKMSDDEEPPKTRSSPRKRTVKGSTAKANGDGDDEPKKKKAKGRPKKKVAATAVDEADDDTEDAKEQTVVKKIVKKKVVKKKVVKKVAAKKAVASDDDDEASPTKKKKKAAAADHQRLTERDELPKLWNGKEHEDSSYTFKICSWNVAGIRALIRNHPDRLETMCREHDLDVLCLQETKLQEMHLDDKKLQIRATVLQPDYDSYYSCSTAKKGYSGTAVFVKKRGVVKGKKKQATLDNFFGAKKDKKIEENDAATDVGDADFTANLMPTDVSYKMGVEAHDQEGRLVIADFPLFSIINCYVPNSGQKLERLDYRTEQWDKDLLKFVQTSKSDTPCIWLGDLNVAHTNLEVWNDGAKHLAKQAGVTVQERDSFQHQLDTSGFKDAFRALHPTAKGSYSYWSQRAGNREPNKGLRLDYFICAPELFDESNKVVARDSYALYDVFGSDHCPVVLELEIKK